MSDGTSKVVFDFSVPVRATQYYTTSDERFKTDIQEIENISDGLSKIIPVSYKLIQNNSENSTHNASKEAGSLISTTNQYGFLAQDVREIYPDLVHEDEDGALSIDYNGFIAILVDAVKNLKSEVASQKETIERLQSKENEQLSKEGESQTISLSQNHPNPFNASTTIDCIIPANISSAFLCVYDLNGNQKLRIDISERGNVSINIDGNTLNPGMYIYTLIADGVEISSKRMILTD